MCGVVSLTLTHSSLGDPEDIFIIHLIIIIRSKVSTIHIVVIFFCGCASQVVVPSYTVGFLYISGVCSFYYCAVSWCAQMIELIMAR